MKIGDIELSKWANCFKCTAFHLNLIHFVEEHDDDDEKTKTVQQIDWQKHKKDNFRKL